MGAAVDADQPSLVHTSLPHKSDDQDVELLELFDLAPLLPPLLLDLPELYPYPPLFPDLPPYEPDFPDFPPWPPLLPDLSEEGELSLSSCQSASSHAHRDETHSITSSVSLDSGKFHTLYPSLLR